MDMDQLIAICRDKERRESRLKNITKECIADILATGSQDDSRLQNLQQTMIALIEEIKEVRKTNEQVIDALEKVKKLEDGVDELKKENSELREQMKKQGEIIKQHQAFFERLDQKDRAQNLIIVGTDEEGGRDKEKALEIIKKLVDGGAQSELASRIKMTRRIGTAAEGKRRPLLVVMSTKEERDLIVEKARNTVLGANVRVKKDTHPAIRAEWTRLFDQKTAEENKPENAGCQITLDLKKRQLLRDGVVIDSWCAQLF